MHALPMLLGLASGRAAAAESTGGSVEREVFRLFGTTTEILFYALAAITVVTFVWGCWRQVGKYRKGRAAARLTPLLPRLRSAFATIVQSSQEVFVAIFVGNRHQPILAFLQR